MLTAIVLIFVISSHIIWELHKLGISEAYAALFSNIDEEVKGQIEKRVGDEVDGLRKTITSLEELAKTNSARLEVKVGEHTGVVEGMRHYQLERLITLVANNLPVMLVGMAGTGKTHAAQQAAEAMGREFYAMSVGAQTSKSDIIGYMHAGGDYVDTLFRRAYEHGGLFLMDEIDAGNANVLIQINAALANEYCAFPDQMVKRHDDFVFVGSANTYGTGANRQYVGRNQLDAATLDRFTILEWGIDSHLEKTLAGQQEGWYKAILRLRTHVIDEGMRVLVSPRATLRGARMLAAGIPLKEVMEHAIVGMFPQDKKDRIREIITEEYNKHKSPGVRPELKERAEKLKEAKNVVESYKANRILTAQLETERHQVPGFWERRR